MLKNTSYFLKLIRFPNLLMIVATQYAIRELLIMPTLKYRFSPILEIEVIDQFGAFNFFLLVLSTVLITAGGFVINDYFDRKTDLINRPKKVIIGTHIKRRTAMTLHWVLNAVGILIGFYISWQINIISLGMVFFFISGLLWFYSTNFNKEFLIGNIIVATLTAMVPLLVLIFTMVPLNIFYKNILQSYMISFNNLSLWILGYTFFAFILTLSREIVKDMEDVEGDSAYGRNSLPIVLGINVTKGIVIALFLTTIVAISIVALNFINHLPSTIFVTITISIPLLWLSYKTIIADNVKDYHYIQIGNKLIMLSGLVYLLFLFFIIKGII